MATTVAHASLIRYDSDGNQLVINLKNTGDDVSINRSSNGNLPSGATTAQGLANALGALAFKSSLSKSDIGLGNVDNTADSSKSVNYATSSGVASSIKIVANNEIRFEKPTEDLSSDASLYVGYRWTDGTQKSMINRYKFCDGAGNLTAIQADKFIGSLVGNASSSSTAYRASISTYLEDTHTNVGMYESNDTHFLQLGYWNCTRNYDTLTLLISSAFWCNQHGSCDILFMQQDMNDNAECSTVHGDFYQSRIGGSHRRKFYYYKSDGKMYLYAYVEGGNSYGRWNVSVLQAPFDGNWVTEFIPNCTPSDAWAIVYEYYTPFEDNLYVSQSTPGHPCIWAKID